MLAGVGGRTIREAKESLSVQEAMAWIEYRNRRGILNLGLRLEERFALLAMILVRQAGVEKGIEDFLLHYDKREATLDDIMKELVKR